jgi:hypothetical protein
MSWLLEAENLHGGCGRGRRNRAPKQAQSLNGETTVQGGADSPWCETRNNAVTPSNVDGIHKECNVQDFRRRMSLQISAG